MFERAKTNQEKEKKRKREAFQKEVNKKITSLEINENEGKVCVTDLHKKISKVLNGNGIYNKVTIREVKRTI